MSTILYLESKVINMIREAGSLKDAFDLFDKKVSRKTGVYLPYETFSKMYQKIIAGKYELCMSDVSKIRTRSRRKKLYLVNIPTKILILGEDNEDA